jgi:hypothetical protein
MRGRRPLHCLALLLLSGDALETDGATGTFWSVSLGLQLRIFGI